MIEVKGEYSTARFMTDEEELSQSEFDQITTCVNHPVFTEDPVVMPDYHYGAGCMIGLTMPLTDKVIPNIVGVDIGCNMLYVSFRRLMELNKGQWLAIDSMVRRAIPMGYKHHPRPRICMEKDFQWGLSSLMASVFTSKLNNKFGTHYKAPEYNMKYFIELCDKVKINRDVAINSLGTLGGGNHFIEFSTSKATGFTGVTLHAGSRGLGLKTANYWQKVATEKMQGTTDEDWDAVVQEIKDNNHRIKWNDMIRAAKKRTVSKPTGLEHLEGDDWFGYLMDMNFCQIYAEVNLNIMMQMILRRLNVPDTFMLSRETTHTIHNYISPDDLIIRKGAIRSIEGQRMLIPGNMEDGILVCEGKSNEKWNNSAPHGAGRNFGRNEMKRRTDVNVDTIRKRMEAKGIFVSVLPKDEVKEAYKDLKFIERVIDPTATVVDRLTPVLNLKAND